VIKLTAFVRRHPDLSVAEFRRHWHEVHGPLIRDTPALARHIARYEQAPTVDQAHSGGYDGVAVIWFDSMEGFRAFVSEPAYRDLVAPDERRLLDTDATRIAFCEVDASVCVVDRSR